MLSVCPKPKFCFCKELMTKLSLEIDGPFYLNLFGKVENFIIILPHNPNFNNPEKEPFENILGKEENAGNQHFLQCFLPNQKKKSLF